MILISKETKRSSTLYFTTSASMVLISAISKLDIDIDNIHIKKLISKAPEISSTFVSQGLQT